MKCPTCGRDKDSGQCLCRPSRTKRKKGKVETVKFRAGHERVQKALVRRRDKGCRFPLCGCRKLGLLVKARPEVSHDKHKGMGGNPIGDRSTADIMVQLCNHRHQDGAISRHKGTLRMRFLTDLNYNGPIATYIELETLLKHWPHLGLKAMVSRTWIDGWVGLIVAFESAPGVLAPLARWQSEVLKQLAEMDL